MKKLLIGLFALGSFSTYADCENAYKVKATKRLKSNKTIATVATHVLFPPSLIELGNLYRDETFRYNTFQKSLEIIQVAKKNKLHPIVLEKMEKKLALSAHTDTTIAEMKRVALASLRYLNRTNQICQIKDGKIKVLSHRRLSNLIIDKVKE